MPKKKPAPRKSRDERIIQARYCGRITKAGVSIGCGRLLPDTEENFPRNSPEGDLRYVCKHCHSGVNEHRRQGRDQAWNRVMKFLRREKLLNLIHPDLLEAMEDEVTR